MLKKRKNQKNNHRLIMYDQGTAKQRSFGLPPEGRGNDVTEILQDIQHHISTLFDLKGFKTLAAVLLTVLHQLFGDCWLPIHGAILTLYCLDWVTGIGAAIASNRKLTSAGGFRGVVKGLIYACTIIVAHQLDTVSVIMGTFGDFVLALITLTEAHSNLENLDTISQHTGLNIPLIGWLIKLIRRYEQWIQSKVEGRIEEDTSDDHLC
jgi:phage-related holin